MAECANGKETGTEEALVALKGKDVAELRAMAQRLEKGQESLQEMLKDLETEREELHKEKAQLNDTISLIMKDLQKLHIGAQNTVEPVLEEGPLDFVGRFWETVKPRDSAYMAGENIGEIRKPGEKAEKPPNAPLAALQHMQQELPQSMQEAAKEVQDMGKQAARKLSTAFEEARSSAWWQKAQGYLDEKRTEIAKKVSEVQANAQAAAQASSMPPRRPRREPKAAPAAEPTQNGPSPAEASEAAPAAADPPAEASSPAKPKTPADKPAEKPAEVPAAEQADPSPTAKSPAADRQETILVQAQVKIGDGSVQPLHVRASDRCKDAAERFVAEHSLKASFVKPLTDFLKKVERDADTFPVHVEATCYPIAESLQTAPELHSDLHEEGGVFEGPRRGVRRESYPMHHGLNAERMREVLPSLKVTESVPEQGWWPGGVEQPAAATDRAHRCAEWLWKLAEEQGAEESRSSESPGAVVCVTHGLFMDRLLKALAGLDPHLGSVLFMSFNCAYWLVQLRLNHDEHTPRIAVMAACNVVDHVPMSIRTGHSMCGISHCQPSYAAS
ncbi:unnamed protein product [Symbiodinium sp. CCMP2592]|nr:unnamed protein product [Symbiodinium sp. CCMP2592]